MCFFLVVVSVASGRVVEHSQREALRLVVLNNDNDNKMEGECERINGYHSHYHSGQNYSRCHCVNDGPVQLAPRGPAS